jgi:hypothetical protein
MGVNRKLGVNAAIVLKYGTADQATIKGLNQLTLPSLTRSKIRSEEFGVDFAVNDAGGGEHGDISYGGNMVIGDTKGQDQLKQYLINNTKFTDARVYIDTVTGDFLAADTAKDTEAGFQVISHTPGQVTKNGTYPFTGAWAVCGLYAVFDIHKVDGDTPTMAFVAATTPGTTSPTITDSGNGFVTAGFKAGDTLIVEGSTSNDGIYSILTVAAGVLTLAVSDSLTSEAAIEGTTLHGGSL